MALDRASRPVSVNGLFGWFHPAKEDAARAPVLMCPPFGLEYLACHAGWRVLAERLAESGHPVLRFDYPGTGNSPGTTALPDQLDAWQASIGMALDALRGATGAPAVLVLGMRLGASLAAQAIAGRGDVAGLVALAPVLNGKRYARELNAVARMAGESNISDTGITVHGFEVLRETLASLGTLMLNAMPAPAPHGLVLACNEDDADLAADWGFAALPFEGFEAFVADPTHARIPEAIFAQVIGWCNAQPTVASGAGEPLPPARFTLPDSTEEAVVFGTAPRLFGVLSRPRGPASALAVLLLNAGRNPASGWGRQSVDLARICAGRGHLVLRIDSNGIGESARAPDSPEEVLYSDRQQGDARAAIALLRASGATHVFIAGACSGAYLGLQTALRAPEVAGAALINQLKYHWNPGDSLDVISAQTAFRPTGAYGRRLFQRDTWARLLQGDINVRGIAGVVVRRTTGLARRITTNLLARFGLAHSPQAEALGWFRDLSRRGVTLALINAAEDPSCVELATYFGPEGRRLAGLPGLHRHLVAGVDHNLSQIAGRARVRELVLAAITRTAQAPAVSGKVAPRQ